jgi:hypothetical protein
MKLKKLSPSMENALLVVYEFGWTPDWTSTTMRALERRGLARWYPYAKREIFTGVWKLTAEGRESAEQLLLSDNN